MWYTYLPLGFEQNAGTYATIWWTVLVETHYQCSKLRVSQTLESFLRNAIQNTFHIHKILFPVCWHSYSIWCVRKNSWSIHTYIYVMSTVYVDRGMAWCTVVGKFLIHFWVIYEWSFYISAIECVKRILQMNYEFCWDLTFND